MPFITANKIHNGYKWLPPKSVLEVTEHGEIIAIHDNWVEGTTKYEGVIIPGFVNAHCHLELSHMKGVVPEHTNLVPFLQTIPKHRNDFSDTQKKEARHLAYLEMLSNGIVAVGDIANTPETTDVKSLDLMHTLTFVEAIGFIEGRAEKSFENAKLVYDQFAGITNGSKVQQQIITPHAPYSVSKGLFGLINNFNIKSIISIHNQESEEENKFYTDKTGDILSLFAALGINIDGFVPSGKTSINTYTDWLSASHQMLFVHNTNTKQEEIQFVQQKFNNVFWCFCPNANLYIENKLPNIPIFIAEQANICIGTDSLASNHQLSLLNELQTLKAHFPQISWETLLKWGTINGAKALKMDQVVGSFEVGKKPGIIQVVGLVEAESKPMVSVLHPC